MDTLEIKFPEGSCKGCTIRVADAEEALALAEFKKSEAILEAEQVRFKEKQRILALEEENHELKKKLEDAKRLPETPAYSYKRRTKYLLPYPIRRRVKSSVHSVFSPPVLQIPDVKGSREQVVADIKR